MTIQLQDLTRPKTNFNPMNTQPQLSRETVSLELAAELKQLGVPQDSIFSHNCMEDHPNSYVSIADETFTKTVFKVSAYTPGELMEKMKQAKIFPSVDFEGDWCCWVKDTVKHHEKLADACAMMMIYLIRSNQISFI